MYKSLLKTYYLFFLLAFGAPALSSAQNNIKDSIDIKVLIDSLNNALNNNYVYPEKAKSIAAYLESQLKNKVYSNESQNPQNLAEKLQRDITKIHHDPHMSIKYEPGFH
ncbi:MAG: hypothetical protein ABI123_05775, partial [Ginsengibacter sp.]